MLLFHNLSCIRPMPCWILQTMLAKHFQQSVVLALGQPSCYCANELFHALEAAIGNSLILPEQTCSEPCPRLRIYLFSGTACGTRWATLEGQAPSGLEESTLQCEEETLRTFSFLHHLESEATPETPILRLFSKFEKQDHPLPSEEGSRIPQMWSCRLCLDPRLQWAL